MDIIANNIDKNGKIRKSKKIVSGKCLFPFKYKGKNHQKCIVGETGDWCATSLTERRAAKTWGYCHSKLDKKKSVSSSSEKSSKKSSNKSSNMIFVDSDNLYTNINQDGIFRKYIKVQEKSSKTWSIGYIQTQEGWILKTSWGKLNKSEREKLYTDKNIQYANSLLKKKILEGYVPFGIYFLFDVSNIIKPDTKDFEIFQEYLKKISKRKKTKKLADVKRKLSFKKSSSSLKKSSSMKKDIPFNRKEKISELTKICIDPYDGILFEEFDEWEDDDLRDAIIIGPENNKRCYKIDSIYRWVEDSIKEGKPLKDPINISHEITKEELENMKNIMKLRLGDKYVSPAEKKIILDEKNVELLISEPNDTWITIPPKYIPNYNKILRYPFYHIKIEISIPGNYRSRIIDLGYIPGGIEPLPGEDSYLSSYSLITSIRKLWDMRKLLTIHHPLKDIQCCTVPLSKPVQYWFDTYGRLDIKKISEFGAELRYQELM